MITDKDIKKLKESFKDSFATKDDLKAMEGRQNDKFATKDDLKAFATKDDLKALAKQKDLEIVKQDVASIRNSLEDLSEFSKSAIGNILDWTQEIHETIVKKNLPKRVTRIEKRFRPLTD